MLRESLRTTDAPLDSTVLSTLVERLCDETDRDIVARMAAPGLPYIRCRVPADFSEESSFVHRWVVRHSDGELLVVSSGDARFSHEVQTIIAPSAQRVVDTLRALETPRAFREFVQACGHRWPVPTGFIAHGGGAEWGFMSIERPAALTAESVASLIISFDQEWPETPSSRPPPLAGTTWRRTRDRTECWNTSFRGSVEFGRCVACLVGSVEERTLLRGVIAAAQPEDEVPIDALALDPGAQELGHGAMFCVLLLGWIAGVLRLRPRRARAR